MLRQVAIAAIAQFFVEEGQEEVQEVQQNAMIPPPPAMGNQLLEKRVAGR